jgi:hypothetical protein
MASNTILLISIVLLLNIILYCNSASILLDGYGGTQLFTPDTAPFVTNALFNNLPHLVGAAIVSTPRGIFIIGGSKNDFMFVNAIADVTVFIPSTRYSYLAAPLKTARSMHAAVSMKGAKHVVCVKCVTISGFQTKITTFWYVVATLFLTL